MPLGRHMNGFRIPALVKVAATKAFAQSPLGQTMRQAANARRLLGVVRSDPSTALFRSISQATGVGNVNGLIRALSTQDPVTAWAHVERYAASGSNEYKLLRELFDTLGPVGRVLGSILPKQGDDYNTLGDSLHQALNMLAAFSDQPEVLDSLERILTTAGATVSWPTGRPVRAIIPTGTGGVAFPKSPKAGITQPESSTQAEPPGYEQRVNTNATTFTVSEGGNVHALAANHPAVTGEWVLTSASSNVHSFAYDMDAHRLYIRFRDRAPPGESRPNTPGSIYAYYNVPIASFMGLFEAGSKGTWIWDNIRIRGTISGHRFDYSLVGIAGGYVPRKATLTAQGESYIGRSVFSDRGRQLRSSRPDQLVRALGRIPTNGLNGLGG